MDAIEVGEEEKARVDSSKCIGCGVCSSTCPSEAVSLVRRETVTSPPDVTEFFTKRYMMPEP
jgi:Na+-translocating ferredoxin:NAD+ oxidoreductase subunit B